MTTTIDRIGFNMMMMMMMHACMRAVLHSIKLKPLPTVILHYIMQM